MRKILVLLLIVVGLSEAHAEGMEERLALFAKCHENPSADATRYGHDGDCYAHCRSGECDQMGFSIRTSMFLACRKDPRADSQIYGHGGNCCAHVTRDEGDFVNRRAGTRLCNYDENPNVSWRELVDIYNYGCTLAMSAGYACLPL